MRLPRSFDVGQTLAAYHWLSTPFPGANSIEILKSLKNEKRINGVLQSSYAYLRMGYGLYSGMFQPGDNFVGFRFDDGAGKGLNYGWAIWNIDLSPDAAAITIKEWAYQSGDDAAIHVGSVPAPPASVAALTMLAMGAAGLRGWRKRTAAGATASGVPDRSAASPK